MKVLVVANRVCARTVKQMIALSNHVELHLVTHTIPEADVFESVSFYHEVDGLKKALKRYEDCDIIHAVSEPSWVVIACREVLPNKKIVYDWHDAQIWRSDKAEDASTEERLVSNWVDGIIVPSQSCKTLIDSPIPTVVLPPYVNKQNIAYNAWGYVGGIVYEGRVDVPEMKSFMDYAKYVDLCKRFEEEGIAFSIYSPFSEKPRHKEVYKNICSWNRGLPYDQLINYLGVYDWGLCGNIGKHREWDVAMPNKLFEYMAGGIPIIALNAKETGDFVEKHGVGISVSSIEEIKDRWDERDRCQKNVMLKRNQFTMEEHIGAVTELYKRVLSQPLKEDKGYAKNIKDNRFGATTNSQEVSN